MCSKRTIMLNIQPHYLRVMCGNSPLMCTFHPHCCLDKEKQNWYSKFYACRQRYQHSQTADICQGSALWANQLAYRTCRVTYWWSRLCQPFVVPSIIISLFLRRLQDERLSKGPPINPVARLVRQVVAKYTALGKWTCVLIREYIFEAQAQFGCT